MVSNLIRSTPAVIPAQAGIQQGNNAFFLNPLDSRLCGNDVLLLSFFKFHSGRCGGVFSYINLISHDTSANATTGSCRELCGDDYATHIATDRVSVFSTDNLSQLDLDTIQEVPYMNVIQTVIVVHHTIRTDVQYG